LKFLFAAVFYRSSTMNLAASAAWTVMDHGLLPLKRTSPFGPGLEQGSRNMAILDHLLKTVRRFTANHAGTTAVTFALSVVPVLLAGGAALDYIRYSSAETALQAALDASALAVAAAGDLSAEKRIEAGKEAFDRNISHADLKPEMANARFELAGTTVKATAQFELPSGLMQIAGIPYMNVSVATEISIPGNKMTEIVLVLDYSGSMEEISGGQVKYVAMKNAASKLISDLARASPGKLKIGLVPFSHHVYVTLPASYVKGKGSSGTWTGCTQDRRNPYNLTDASPTSGDDTKWGQPIAKVHAADSCDGYPPRNLKVQPLTNDFGSLREQLDSMRPYAWNSAITYCRRTTRFRRPLPMATGRFTRSWWSSPMAARRNRPLVTVCAM
jgi:hypothetical protein